MAQMQVQMQMQMQAQTQVELQASQQILAELLMSQIDSLFESFEAAIKYKNSGNANRNGMVLFNDSVVSVLDLFGAECDKYKNEKERDILCAVYAYFLQKKQSSLPSMKEQDVAVISNWLMYMEASLTSDQKSRKLQISKQTVQIAEKNMQNRFSGVMSTILGKNHESLEIGENVQRNAAQYQQRNDSWCKQTKAAYNSARQTSQCPTQNDMYNYTGAGGANLRFVSASQQFGTTAVHIDWMDEDGDEEEQEENKNEQQEMPSSCTGHDHAQSYNRPQPPYHAALTKQGPVNFPRGTAGSFTMVAVLCPVPCRVIEVLDSERVRIQLAAPYNDISVPCNVNELQLDAKKVAKLEAAYLRQNNLKNLGYQ